MNLTFIQKSVYGKTLFYPTNDAAKSICLVANQKTLTQKDLNNLYRGGFSIEVTAVVDIFKKSTESSNGLSEV